jgi:hypothetical protein
VKDFLTLATVTAFCLAYKSSRNFGWGLLGLLYLAYPSATLVTLIVAGIAYLKLKEK